MYKSITYYYNKVYNGYFIYINQFLLKQYSEKKLLNITTEELYEIIKSFNVELFKNPFESGYIYKFNNEEDVQLAVTTLKLLV